MSKYGTYIYRWNKEKAKHSYEHRDVMERHLGRQLLTNEVVHHIDGNTHNNDLSNLELIDLSAHTSMHLNGVSRGLCSICGDKQHAKHLCKKHYQQMLRDR